jgi:hypothetical protein
MLMKRMLLGLIATGSEIFASAQIQFGIKAFGFFLSFHTALDRFYN